MQKEFRTTKEVAPSLTLEQDPHKNVFLPAYEQQTLAESLFPLAITLLYIHMPISLNWGLVVQHVPEEYSFARALMGLT